MVYEMQYSGLFSETLQRCLLFAIYCQLSIAKGVINGTTMSKIHLLALALYLGRCCCIGIRLRFHRLLPRPNVFDIGPVGGRRADAAR